MSVGICQGEKKKCASEQVSYVASISSWCPFISTLQSWWKWYRISHFIFLTGATSSSRLQCPIFVLHLVEEQTSDARGVKCTPLNCCFPATSISWNVQMVIANYVTGAF